MMFLLLAACTRNTKPIDSGTTIGTTPTDSTPLTDSTPSDTGGSSTTDTSSTTSPTDSGTTTTDSGTTEPETSLKLWWDMSGAYTVTPSYGWVTVGEVAMCTSLDAVSVAEVTLDPYASYDPVAGDPYQLGSAVSTDGSDSVSFFSRFTSCTLSGTDSVGTFSIPGTISLSAVSFDIPDAIVRSIIVTELCGGPYYLALEVECDVNSAPPRGGVANGYALDILPNDTHGLTAVSGGRPVTVNVATYNVNEGVATSALLVDNP